MAKLLLIDGHALLYRAYHATSDATMTTSRGEPTNAIFAFAGVLLKVLQSETPTHAAVAFDLPTPTFRHEAYGEYKAHRPPMADALVAQVNRVRELVEVFGFPIYEAPGFEADDVLGTLARQAAAQAVDTVILSGDLDTLQLIGPHVRVLTPGRGPVTTSLYDASAVEARYGLTPRQLPDYKALVGDTSDNIPGVPGIGAKTASKLLVEFPTIEDVFRNLDALPERTRKLLEGREAQAVASKYLATIVTDVPIELDLGRGELWHYDRDAAFRLFTELEFFSLIDRLPQPGSSGMAAPPKFTAPPRSTPEAPTLFDLGPETLAEETILTGATVGGAPLAAPVEEKSEPSTVGMGGYDEAGEPGTVAYVIDTEEALSELVARLDQGREWTIDLETTGKNPISSVLVGIALSTDPGIGYYIPVGHLEGTQLPREQVLQALRPWLERVDAPKIGHNIKYDLVVLRQHGYDMRGITVDTMIAAYVLNPTLRGLGLKDQAASRFGVHMTPISQLIGTGKHQRTMAEAPILDAAAYAAADADMTLRLREVLEPELRDRDQWALFSQVEMPLVPVLADMERAGVDLDVEFLATMSGELQAAFAAIEARIFDLVGHPFNINSPKQLEAVLFRERGLQPGKRTATGFSTDFDVLDRLRGKDPVVDLVLEYRQLTKLRSTYVEGLPALVNPLTGRVHTSFNQTVAATGRLSSSEPNLQNIPIRSELGARVRRAFIVREPGWVLLAADYSQIELRIVAHLSHDERLLNAFRQGQDIHAATAALVFNVPVEQVTSTMRGLAKTVNFGIIYGQSAFGLAPRAGVSQQEARDFIEQYNTTYSGLYAYMERTREQAIKQQFVTTLMNRRRYLPEVASPVRALREEALRQAINMPVQGTAADMIKVAMIRLAERLPAAGLHGRMILQVHDELLFRVPEGELHQTAALVRETMEEAMPLEIPVRVDLEWGRDWYALTPLVEATAAP
ncbi:MAG TPA: DNA polymerase I [Chloroflexota bacterium]|nr:DNA polymerase I [Chloroflexota bacterium]